MLTPRATLNGSGHFVAVGSQTWKVTFEHRYPHDVLALLMREPI